jgi:CubicO group peptidase (beta-lactamase class C family)/membrane protease YdiL (CAAX protease family)
MSTLGHKLLPAPATARHALTTRFREWIAQHQVVAFFAFAYVFSWLLWLAPALGLRGPLGLVLLYIGVFGPAVAAATITRLTGGSLRAWLRELVHFRAAPRWYAAVIGFPIALVATLTAAFLVTGGAIETSLLGERVAAYLPLLVIWTLAGVGEEPGWRGFALPRLHESLSPVRATLLLGVLWALWHLPLLAAADEPSHGLDAVPLVGVTLLFIAAIVGYSFFYTYLWNRTRNVWLAILLHGSITAANGAFILMPSDDQVGGTYAHLQVLITAVVALFALALVRATHGRLGLAATETTHTTPGSKPTTRFRFLVQSLIALVAAGTAVAGSAGATAPETGPAMSRIDGFVEEQMDARQVPGFALAIVRGGEVVHARGFGSADGSGRPVTVDTPFVLGSVTKSFTALAVMQLVDAGKVSLDAPVARYVPELRLAGGTEQGITVRQLLNQTSGIPGLAGGRLLRSVGDGTLEDAVRELDGTQLSAPPGTRFEYANANYVLLGLVIERSSGESYGAYVERHIFEPLGMRNSFASPEAAKAAGLAVGHRYWFGFAVAHGPTSPDAVRPAGYLMSSAVDMARYLAMYLNGGILDGRRIISRKALETMLEPVGAGHLGQWADDQETRYAMGWFVGGPWQERALLHPGRDPDSSAMIVLLPRQRLAVITLANASLELPLPGGASSLQRIARGVVSLLVGEQPASGIAFARLYVIFDAVVVLILAALVWSLGRLLRRRRRLVRGWRLASRMLRAAVEAAIGFLLLAAPVLVGQGWSGAMLWWPDLALVLLAVGGLLVVTGAFRIMAQILARKAAVPEPAVAPAAAGALPHSGAHARPRRVRFAPRGHRRHAPRRTARRRTRS